MYIATLINMAVQYNMLRWRCTIRGVCILWFGVRCVNKHVRCSVYITDCLLSYITLVLVFCILEQGQQQYISRHANHLAYHSCFASVFVQSCTLTPVYVCVKWTTPNIINHISNVWQNRSVVNVLHVCHACIHITYYPGTGGCASKIILTIVYFLLKCDGR